MTEALNDSLLQRDPDSAGAPRIGGMSEVGYVGTKVISKQILEEESREWRMPRRVSTVNQMAKYHAIAAALQFYTVMLARTPYQITVGAEATDAEKERAKFVQTCLNDMDDSFFSTLVSALSYLRYGFSIHEKQYKRRVKGKSKYKDGLIGLAGLKPRSQSTISGWLYSEDGRTLKGVEQSTENMEYGARYAVLGTKIEIPREKIAIFSCSPMNSNPEGTSLLRGAYDAWRKAIEIENSELLGIAKDLGGIFKMGIPAAYLDPNADAGKKAVADEFKKVLRNISQGEQSGILLPSDSDETTKKELFTADIMQSQSGKSYDTVDILNRVDSRILLALSADILNVGNGASGSLSLVEGKSELVEMGLEYRLQEIADVFNKDVIPQLYEMNGWDTAGCAKMVFGNISKPSLDSISKFLQRTGATNTIEIDRELLNYSRGALGLAPKPDDEEPNLPEPATSRSGDGLVEGMGNGTGKSNGSSGNSSDKNADNAE